MSCSKPVTHQQHFPFSKCPIIAHVQPHTSTPRRQVAQRSTTITPVRYVKRKVPMAVTVVKQRPRPDARSTEILQAQMFPTTLSVCLPVCIGVVPMNVSSLQTAIKATKSRVATEGPDRPHPLRTDTHRRGVVAQDTRLGLNEQHSHQSARRQPCECTTFPHQAPHAHEHTAMHPTPQSCKPSQGTTTTTTNTTTPAAVQQARKACLIDSQDGPSRHA